MKRILLIILAMFALSSFYGKAQIADVRTLDYKSGNLYLDGNKVKKAAARDLFDNDMYKDFKGGRRKWNAGVGVLSFGGTVTTFGGGEYAPVRQGGSRAVPNVPVYTRLGSNGVFVHGSNDFNRTCLNSYVDLRFGSEQGVRCASANTCAHCNRRKGRKQYLCLLFHI